MNAIVSATTSSEIIKAERAKIIARIKAESSATGQKHGALAGAYAVQACTATAHTANKARVATTSYATGFMAGFAQGWKG